MINSYRIMFRSIFATCFVLIAPRPLKMEFEATRPLAKMIKVPKRTVRRMLLHLRIGSNPISLGVYEQQGPYPLRGIN